MFPCYSTIIIEGDLAALASDKSESPYVGTATLLVLPPEQTAPTAYPISTDANGHWELPLYVDVPELWRYVVRVGSVVRAATEDLSFEVYHTHFPAPEQVNG